MKDSKIEMTRKIKSALISVYHKDKLDELVKLLDGYGVSIYSTGGTLGFIESIGINARKVEELTGYPSILGGRVKTLHPKVFGGILARRNSSDDVRQLREYDIPEVDLVVVDLYPFEDTVKSGASESEIIEKIDIGGISLIRAAAKNYRDVTIISHREQYNRLIDILSENKGSITQEQRKRFAMEAFAVSSHYDSAIFHYFAGDFPPPAFRASVNGCKALRYGENPHQQGAFYGDFNAHFEQLHGKEVSYNNLLDIDAAVSLIRDFSETTVAVLKHNNACGVASRDNLLDAWKAALAGDPVSAFGGVIITNSSLTPDVASEINRIFFEVIIAPGYSPEALEILKQKKNRIILRMNNFTLPGYSFRSLLNGVLVQERDTVVENLQQLKVVTRTEPTEQQLNDMLFANIIVKHSKSNAIVLVKNKQLVGSGVGQTSRVDAVRHAIEKAKSFKLDLQDAVMASDAFFPFADSVEIASAEGVSAVIQPGGSIRDKESIDFCNTHGVAMVFSGTRHFKH